MWQIINNPTWDNIYNTFDWVQDMAATPQDALYHAEGDVAIHTKMVLEALLQLPEYQALSQQDQYILFAAALLHDVEKRSTTITEPDGRIASPGHAKKGEYTARRLLYQDIPAPFLVKEAVAKLVRYHGLPLWVFDKPNPQKALLQTSLEVNTAHLALLARADVLGRICTDQADLLYKIDLFEEFCKEQQCWGQARQFPSDLARFHYFQKEESYPDYEPFDDTRVDVVMIAGLPGVGKDTFIRKYYPKTTVLSLDDLRRQLKIDPTDKSGNGTVIQMIKQEAKRLLAKQQPFIWNATNITRQMRGQLMDLFLTYKAKVKIIYLEVPYERLVLQNDDRDHPVPPAVLERMIARLEVPSPVEAHEVRLVFE
ncbi:MAG: AAA family ATPase [Saprospiraceae bacterium]